MAAGSGSRTGTKKSTGTTGSTRGAGRSTRSTGTGKSTGGSGSGKSTRSTSSGKSTRSTGRTGRGGSRSGSGARTGTGSRTGKPKQSAAARRQQQELYQEAAFIVVCVFLAFLFLCNFGIAGPVGNFLKGIMFGLFGLTAYAAPLLLAAGVIFWWINRGQGIAYRKIIPGFLLLIDAGAFCELFAKRLDDMEQYSIVSLYENSAEYWNGGGALGGSVAYCLYHFLSTAGAVLILLAVALICVVLLTEKSFVGWMQSMGEAAGSTASRGAESARRRQQQRAEDRRNRRDQEAEETEDLEEESGAEKRGAFFPWVHMLNNDTRSTRAEKSTAGGEDDWIRESADSASKQTAVWGNSETAEDQEAPFYKSARVHEPEPSKPVQKEAEPEEPGTAVIDFDGIRELTRRRTYYQQEIWPEPGEGDSQQEMGGRSAGAEAWQGSLGRAAGMGTQPESFRRSGEAGYFRESRDRTGEMEALQGSPGRAGGMEAQQGSLGRAGGMEAQQGSPGRAGGTEAWQEMRSRSGERKPSQGGWPEAGEVASREQDYEEPGFREPEGELPPGEYVQREIPREILYGKGSSDPAGKRVPESAQRPKAEYRFPPLSFLNPGKPGKGDSPRELEETARRLKECLETFGVRVTITNISKGPAVTRYEIQPEQGVKVSKIVNLSDDIKLNLAATDIRIEAPIPGKAAIGIEVPNRENSPVPLRDLLESAEYRNFKTEKSKLAFAVGKDISGKVVVTDIAKMPHVLIAGATGSGKSVCINTIILSLIYKASPEDVQMIMIDPKVVELNIYNGIPHLMIPVVTDPKKAASALHWGVAEMMDRYEKFAQLGVRDLNGYNAKAMSLKVAEDGTELKKLPQIVIIVDELADLMMVSPGEVEESICRLAQLARAAGIHLIIATQRPSVDVITGLIKANMPSRIAFSVTSGVDSRTILDMNGAEKLLGKGDMLFYPQGYAKPTRIQGAFVTEEEIQRVVDFLKNQKLGNVYQADIEEKMKNLDSSAEADGQSAGQAAANNRDVLFPEVGRYIIQKDMEKGDKPPSIGMLQRVFKIGFNRAARIMDQLSEYGVVSEAEGTKPRKLLMNMEQFEQLLEEI